MATLKKKFSALSSKFDTNSFIMGCVIKFQYSSRMSFDLQLFTILPAAVGTSKWPSNFYFESLWTRIPTNHLSHFYESVLIWILAAPWKSQKSSIAVLSFAIGEKVHKSSIEQSSYSVWRYCCSSLNKGSTAWHRNMRFIWRSRWFCLQVNK